MLTEILHIGFVVKSIDATLEQLKKLGASEIGRKEMPTIGQTSALIQLGNVRYELMEPLGDTGVVPKYLEKHGEGFHHISFKCDSADKEAARLIAEGVTLLNKVPGDGKTKFFTSPKTTGGVVYEVNENYD